jgi:hypothetical protein
MVTLLDQGFDCLRRGHRRDDEQLVTDEISLPKPPTRFAPTAAFDFAGPAPAQQTVEAPAPAPFPAAAPAAAKTPTRVARAKPVAAGRQDVQPVAFR